jgi:hypothetical protein
VLIEIQLILSISNFDCERVYCENCSLGFFIFPFDEFGSYVLGLPNKEIFDFQIQCNL